MISAPPTSGIAGLNGDLLENPGLFLILMGQKRQRGTPPLEKVLLPWLERNLGLPVQQTDEASGSLLDYAGTVRKLRKKAREASSVHVISYRSKPPEVIRELSGDGKLNRKSRPDLLLWANYHKNQRSIYLGVVQPRRQTGVLYRTLLTLSEDGKSIASSLALETLSRG